MLNEKKDERLKFYLIKFCIYSVYIFNKFIYPTYIDTCHDPKKAISLL